jgi:hypothetical protein
MSNQASPKSGNPGDSKSSVYGQPGFGVPGGPPAPAQIPVMPQMMPGMPYPPYMMFPMGGPYFMPPPPSHGEGGPEMQYPGGPPLMPPGSFGYPAHPAMMGMMPVQHQMNPNVATFVPQSGARPPKQPAATVSAPESVSKSTPAASTDEKESSQSAPPAKPVSKRLAIIDPTTGEEISFQPAKSLGPVSPPASALVSADIALGQTAPVRPLIPRTSTTTSESGGAPLNVPPPSSEPQTSSSPPSSEEQQPVTATSVTPEPSPTERSSMRMKLKNAPLPKPVPVPPPVATPSEEELQNQALGVKSLKRIKNVAIQRRPTTETLTPPLETPKPVAAPPTTTGSKFKLVNKTITSTSSVSSVSKPSGTAFVPIPREVFLRYMSQSRPDRNAPSSINVFPSELLGLRTAPHGDPGLLIRGGSRRGALQKSVSGTSVNWRSGGGKQQLGRTLSRQSSKSGRSLVNTVVKPSERGFKIIDQSSLSEKDKLRRQTMSLLNKITVDSFQAITNQIAEIEITQPWQMDVVIGLIFDKAVVEHSFSEMYAEMCKKLRTTWPELTGVDQETGQSVPVTFTRAIIEKCQVEFDAIPDTLEPTEADIAKARGNPEDLEMFMQKRKERILGNMKFIAQLFLMRILSSKVIRSVVEQLLFRTDEPEEHYIECVGILLHNIGATLMESESGRAYVGQFVERMKDLISRPSYGKRIKFLMQDIIDAARAGWSGKHAGSRLVSSVKSKEEVRKAAMNEQQTGGGRFAGKTSSQTRNPPQTTSFRPTGVLRRASQEETAVAPKPDDEDEDWSNEEDEQEDEEEDEVSEYESSAEEEEEDGFTRVDSSSNRKK